MTRESLRATAEWYVAAKHRQDQRAEARQTPLNPVESVEEDELAAFEQYMSGPHPFLDYLDHRHAQ